MSSFSSALDRDGYDDTGSTSDINESDNTRDYGEDTNDFDDVDSKESLEDFEYNDQEMGHTPLNEKDSSRQELSSDEKADQICTDFENNANKGAKDVSNSDINDSSKRTEGNEGSKVESSEKAANGLYTNSFDDSDSTATKIDGQVKEIPKADLDKNLSTTFVDGEYRTVETQEDVKLYRVYGGKAQEGGGFATTEPFTSEEEYRQKNALSPEWENSCEYEVEITVPKGETLNVGKSAKQVDSKTGDEYSGGGDQVLLPEDWLENHPDWVTNERVLKED